MKTDGDLISSRAYAKHEDKMKKQKVNRHIEPVLPRVEVPLDAVTQS
jgi:hypothetical protein